MKTKSRFFLLFFFVALLLCVFGMGSFTEKQGVSADSSYSYSMITASYSDTVSGKSQSYSFGYSDALFENNRENGTLAKASMAIAAVCYSSASAVSSLVQRLGFSVLYQANYSRTATQLDCDFVAFTIAAKQMTFDSKTYTVYGVFIRGTAQNGEWYSNFNMGQDSTHYGFATAAAEIYDYLDQIVADRETSKIWITGHSRGASVGNLLAAELNASETLAYRENICAYNFACPATTTKAVAYSNIFNYAIGGDVVSAMPLPDWGFDRHGITYVFSSDLNDEAKALFASTTGVTFAAKEDTQEFCEAMVAWCPTQASYDESKYGGLGSTPHQLINKIIPVLMGEEMDTVTILDVGMNLKALSVLLYFQQNQTAIIHAHAPVSYLCYLDAMYPHEHVYEYVSDGNATCTQDGTMTGTCYCGSVITGVTEEGSATGHSFLVSIDSDGIITYTCENCGMSMSGRDISYAASSGVSASYEYLGEPIEPAVTLTFLSATLVEGTDYEIEYRNNDGVGTASIVITGKNAYSGYKTIEFDIVAHEHTFRVYRSDNNATCTEDGTKSAVCAVCGETDTVADEGSALGHDYVETEVNGVPVFVCTRCGESFTGRNLAYSSVAEIDDIEYLGTPVTPSVEVTFFGDLLEEGVDYELSYLDNDGVGTATVVVTGIGDYTGSTEATFEIIDHTHVFGKYTADNNATCEADATKSATCLVCGATDSVAIEGTALGHDYEEVEDTVLLADGSTQTVTVYVCSRCGDVVTDNDLSHSYIMPIGTVTHGADPVEPSFDLYFLGEILTEGKDYTVTYAHNDAAGTGTVTVTGIGDYYGERTFTFTIVEHEHVYGTYVSDGNATCTEDGTKTAACTICGATDTVADEGSATGHTYVAHEDENGVIAQICEDCGDTYYEYDIAFATIADIGTVEYYGKAVYPEPEVTYGGVLLVKGRDYTLSYADNEAAGTGTVTVTGKGDYVGSISVTFTIEAHKYVLDGYVYNEDATCTEDGTKTGVNEETGLTDTVVALGTALGHDYVSGGIIDGVETLVCSRCGDTVTRYHLDYATVVVGENAVQNGTLVSSEVQVYLGDLLLEEGEHYTLTVKYREGEEMLGITLKFTALGDATGSYEYSFEVPVETDDSLSPVPFIVVGAVLLAAGGGFAFFYFKRKKTRGQADSQDGESDNQGDSQEDKTDNQGGGTGDQDKN